MFNFSEGEILLIDKELNWTSFDVVNFLKPAIWSYEEKKTGVRNKIKIGHAGTLDPLATGLLIVCTGKKTKEINTIQQLPKTYTGTFYIGATTPSFDRELKVDKEYPTSHITEELILSTAKSMIGPQLQTPPIYSAVSINGVRAYQLARNNIEVVLSPKKIEIYRFEIKNINFPLVDFEIDCSKGTYIRAIARDFGIKLNSGAYLHSLRRTKIGNYSVDNALPVKKFLDILKKLEN
jgi:tRNA pseudouridine55 synthase